MAEKDISFKITLKDQMTSELNKAAGDITGAFAKMAGGIVSVTAAYALLSDALKESLAAYEDDTNSILQLDNTLKNLGDSVGVSSEQVLKLSEKFQENRGVIDDWVQKGVLAAINANSKFAAGGEGSLESLTELAMNLTAKIGGGQVTEESLTGSFQALARMMEQPERALRLLRGQGIGFTQEQDEAIKNMVKHGDSAKATAVMMDLLREKTDGAYDAVSDLTKAHREVAAAADSFYGNIGKVFGPAVSSLQLKFIDLTKSIVEFTQKQSASTEGILKSLPIFGLAVTAVDAFMKKKQGAAGVEVKAAADSADAAKKSATATVIANELSAISAEKRAARVKKSGDAEKKANDARVDDIIEKNQYLAEESSRKSDAYYAEEEKKAEGFAATQQKIEQMKQDGLSALRAMGNSKYAALSIAAKATDMAHLASTIPKMATDAYSAMAVLPIIGPALGIAAAVAASLYGAEQMAIMAGVQFPAAAKGAAIPGSPGGTALVVGDQNKNEWVLDKGHLKEIAKLMGSGRGQNINARLEINRATLQNWNIQSSFQNLTLSREGRKPSNA